MNPLRAVNSRLPHQKEGQKKLGPAASLYHPPPPPGIWALPCPLELSDWDSCPYPPPHILHLCHMLRLSHWPRLRLRQPWALQILWEVLGKAILG